MKAGTEESEVESLYKIFSKYMELMHEPIKAYPDSETKNTTIYENKFGEELFRYHDLGICFYDGNFFLGKLPQYIPQISNWLKKNSLDNQIESYYETYNKKIITRYFEQISGKKPSQMI